MTVAVKLIIPDRSDMLEGSEMKAGGNYDTGGGY